jgi:hypothetical protein
VNKKRLPQGSLFTLTMFGFLTPRILENSLCGLVELDHLDELVHFVELVELVELG